MKEHLLRLRGDLGAAGLAAISLLSLAVLAHFFLLRPLEARNDALKATLAVQSERSAAQPAVRSGEKLASVYRYLGREEATTDWLAKLHGIGQASGVALNAADYRPQAASEGGRIERFEIVMPVAGTYPQLRDFIGRALAEIPVLSLDQLSIKRESHDQGEVQAELRMTLHMVKR